MASHVAKHVFRLYPKLFFTYSDKKVDLFSLFTHPRVIWLELRLNILNRPCSSLAGLWGGAVPQHWGVLGRRRICYSHGNHHGNTEVDLSSRFPPKGSHSVTFPSLSVSHVADGRHVHPWVQVLLGEDGPSALASGPKWALQHSQGHWWLGPGLCGSHLSWQRWWRSASAEFA